MLNNWLESFSPLCHANRSKTKIKGKGGLKVGSRWSRVKVVWNAHSRTLLQWEMGGAKISSTARSLHAGTSGPLSDIRGQGGGNLPLEIKFCNGIMSEAAWPSG